MSDEVKSALEIAMERASRLGKLTPKEAEELKWGPEGERIAALYLRGEADLAKAMGALEPEAAAPVLKGLLSVLLANLALPRTEASAATNSRVISALRTLCSDTKTLDAVWGRVSYVFDQYSTYGRQQMQRTYQELKQQFLAAVQQKPRQQRVQASRAAVDVESMPEFQAQWRVAVSNVEQQYEQHLAEYRRQLNELVLAKPRLR